MDNLAICAEHEAAHVVLYLDLGYPIFSVEIHENGSGLTKSRAEPYWIDNLDHAAILMAGPVIEDRYNPIPLEERARMSLQRRAVLEGARVGRDRHNFEELARGPADDDSEDGEWWRLNGRDFVIEVLENALDDVDSVNPELIEVGYNWASRVLQRCAHDHALITEALLAKRSLSADDIYALPLINLPPEPSK